VSGKTKCGEVKTGDIALIKMAREVAETRTELDGYSTLQKHSRDTPKEREVLSESLLKSVYKSRESEKDLYAGFNNVPEEKSNKRLHPLLKVL